MKYHLAINPRPMLRARTVNQHGRIHTYSPSEDDKNALAWLLKAQNPTMIPAHVPVAITVTFWLLQPKRASYDQPVVKPDWENLAKLLGDAGTGILWADDAQIVEAHTYKKYTDKEPGIELEVVRLRSL